MRKSSGRDATGSAPTVPGGDDAARFLFERLTGGVDGALSRDISHDQIPYVPRNFLLTVAAQALSKCGDVLADPKIVLPWLIATVGAPLFMIGLLVPIRESLALLPQVPVGGLARQFAVRKWFWSVASVVQGAAILLMGVVGLVGMRGAPAGWAIVGLLIVFSLARGVGSVTSKDTLGRTIPKGLRGRVSGHAATLAGVVAALVGLVLLSPPADRSQWLLYAMLIAAGCTWFVGAAIFATLRELPADTDGRGNMVDLVRHQASLLARDGELRKFIAARALMISTALAGPVYVGLARQVDGSSLAALGGLILASGIANLGSSWLWGAFADLSSRATMAAGGAICGILGLAVLAAMHLFPVLREYPMFFTATILVLYVGHAGVRIGRKTQVVDLAGPDAKSDYVALSNTIIGILLLTLGALVGGLIAFGLEWALLAVSVLALLASGLAMRMRNVQR